MNLMDKDDKTNVYKSYEKIADWFDQNRSRELFEQTYLDKVMTYLNSSSHILDIGCGMGEPIAQYFIGKSYFY